MIIIRMKIHLLSRLTFDIFLPLKYMKNNKNCFLKQIFPFLESPKLILMMIVVVVWCQEFKD